jgi:hypothetical protein
MLIKMSKKPTHGALCHRWTIGHNFFDSMSNIVQGERGFCLFYWFFIAVSLTFCQNCSYNTYQVCTKPTRLYKNIKNIVIFTWVQIKTANTHENVYIRVLINFLQRLPEQRMYTQPSCLMSRWTCAHEQLWACAHTLMQDEHMSMCSWAVMSMCSYAHRTKWAHAWTV